MTPEDKARRLLAQDPLPSDAWDRMRSYYREARRHPTPDHHLVWPWLFESPRLIALGARPRPGDLPTAMALYKARFGELPTVIGDPDPVRTISRALDTGKPIPSTGTAPPDAIV